MRRASYLWLRLVHGLIKSEPYSLLSGFQGDEIVVISCIVACDNYTEVFEFSKETLNSFALFVDGDGECLRVKETIMLAPAFSREPSIGVLGHRDRSERPPPTPTYARQPK